MPPAGDAHSKETLQLYRDLVGEYAHHLEWMRQQRFEPAKRDQQLVVGLLAISAYNSAKAILALYEAEQGSASLVFVRSQFEQAAKADYLAQNADRSRAFLDSEPFERYKLTQDYPVRESLRSEIVTECKRVVVQKPRLLKYQSAKRKGKLRPDFAAIREALKPPKMREILKALKWNMDLYVSIYLFGSLQIHGNINDLRNYLGEQEDGTYGFVPEQMLRGEPDFLMQSCAYLFGFIGRIATWFPGANRDEEVQALYRRHQELWKRMQE